MDEKTTVSGFSFSKKPRRGHVLIPTIKDVQVNYVRTRNRSDQPRQVATGARVRKGADGSTNFGDD
jgi:hypothetical protein